MAENIALQGRFTEVTPREGIEEGVSSSILDPLRLDIPDEDLVEIVDDWIQDSRSFMAEEYDLYERRRKLEVYRFGRQILEKEKEKALKNYESRFMDNVLYEIEATIKPLAMSRLPDLLVTPGNDSDDAVLTAQELSKAIDTQIKERENRRVLGLAFEHHPVYMTGIIKGRWDPEIDDYVFEVIHPDLIDVDHTCPVNDADRMKFVSQLVPLTIQQVMLRFPDRKEKFIEELKKDGIITTDTPSFTHLATVINIREVWFDEYIRHSETEVEKVSGLLWKYGDCILKKMKNPNFDYEGEEKYYSYDQNGTKRGLSPEEMMMALASGQLPQTVSKERVYNNYFRFPRKPFYFMGYDQWGRMPYDVTSRIEQNLGNQKAIDKRGKQIEETLDNRGHHIFSKESGLTPADVEEMDMADPDEDVVVDGDVNRTHKYIPPERPDKQEFDEMTNLRNRAYAVAGSNAVRGQIQSPVATTNQIAREADFTRADDLVEDTINDAAEWMAQWSMQFIKLRYTVDHFREILGDAGEAVYIKLNRNMVSDGMIVKIKASGTDKIRAQNNAMEMAKMQMTDPFTFFTDMGLSDPEGRTERLILAKTDPVAYLQKVVKGVNTSQALAEMLMRQEIPSPPVQPPAPQPPPTAPGAPPANPMMAQGQGAPQAPQQPSPTNTGAAPMSPPAGAPMGSPRNL